MKQTKQLTRRNFLKGAAYTSALSIGGVSGVAFAANNNNSKVNASTSQITLFNQSDRTVALDATQPVNLKKVKGWVLVEINKASDESILNLKMDEIITLSAGQQLAFEVDSELAPLLKDSGDHIVITNEYGALNNTVPVTTYDTLVA